MKPIRLLFLLLFTLASCSGQTTYTIKQGQNYPTPKQFTTHGSISAMVKTVTFDASCIYQLGNEDDADINKLFGWGVGLTNQHSLRIGWNCKSGGGIDLYAYIHYNGQRWVIPKDSIIEGSGQLIGKGFKTGLPIACGIYRARDSITFEATQEGVKRKYVIRFANFPDGFGWYQYPYFGGTSTAPHTMIIIIR